MKVSTEKDNHFGYEKITIVADNLLQTTGGKHKPNIVSMRKS